MEAIKKVEKHLGLTTLNQQLKLRTGINFTQKIADIICDPNAVHEHDIKQFMSTHFPGAKENRVTENDKTLAKLLNEFAKIFKIVVFGKGKERSKEIFLPKTLPSIDDYDNQKVQVKTNTKRKITFLRD